MNTKLSIRILVADDHPVVRDGLIAAIGRQPDMKVVGSAANGREAVDLYRNLTPDVTLMDLRMPEMDGISATTAIHADFPDARIMMLTVYEGDVEIFRSVRAGAIGYLLKGAPMHEIVEAIRVVHQGEPYFAPDVALKLAAGMNSQVLTPREIEVLQLMAQGYNNQGIATTLTIMEGTVKVHVGHILEKLKADDRTQAVTIALRRGILRLD